MKIDNNLDIIEKFTSSSIFSCCSQKDLSSIVPPLKIFKKKFGEKIYQKGEDANSLFFIVKGDIKLLSGKRVVSQISNGIFGEEAVNPKGHYISSAVADGNTTILALDKKSLLELVAIYPTLKDNLYISLISHHSDKEIGNDWKIEKKKIKDEQATTSKVIGWILTMVVPLVVMIFGDNYGFDWKSKIFIAVFLTTVVMWIFRLSYEFVPSILAVLVLLVLNIAPPSVALSGFTSGSFFIAMSIFGISALLVSSGLTYRLVINLFRILPMSQFWHSWAIFITGIFLTPILPSANGRVGLASPILIDMVESLGYKPKGKAATRLAVATFSGFTMFSSIFLSSKAIHFVVFGLLPQQIRDQFNWGYWFYASSIAGLVMLLLYFITTHFIFDNNEKSQLTKDVIDIQHRILGPMTKGEWAALGGIALFAIGVATSSIHKIQLSWVGLTVLYIILVSGFLSKTDFRINIDWSFLIYLATLIGLVRSMSYIGLDIILGKNLIWLGTYAKNNFYLFIFMLILTVVVMRIFIPNNATVAIVASVLFPISAIIGINTWVVGFVILMISDSWFMPYQSTYYILFDDLISEKKLFDKMEILKVNAISFSFRIIAIYASIPFWKFIGIL